MHPEPRASLFCSSSKGLAAAWLPLPSPNMDSPARSRPIKLKAAAECITRGGLQLGCVPVDDSLTRAGMSAAPNTLVLVSPALALEADAWLQRLLLGRATVQSISPTMNCRTIACR